MRRIIGIIILFGLTAWIIFLFSGCKSIIHDFQEYHHPTENIVNDPSEIKDSSNK